MAIHRISADFIHPGNGPMLPQGVLVVDENGVILAIENQRLGNEIIYKGVLCPGFINVHCHTELSYAKGLIAPQKGINAFISDLENLKKTIKEEEKIKAIEAALIQMESEGIVAVGDIMNTTMSLPVKAKSKIKFYNFIEVYGSQNASADLVFSKAKVLLSQTPLPCAITPHAPYSVSEPLFQHICSQSKDSILSIHHAESEAEIKFFEKGEGPFAIRFENWQLPLPQHIPSLDRPLTWIMKQTSEQQNLLLIHNTFINKNDLKWVNQRKLLLGLCPKANLYIENKLPPMDLLNEFRSVICLGTDSLASNDRLSILEEMLTLKQAFNLNWQDLIQFATYNGAKALGFENELGTFEIGKNPGINLISFKEDQPRITVIDTNFYSKN